MQVRAFGSMGAEGINDKNYANVFMNTPINMNGAGAIGKMMGRGNKYNWRCGDCFESSVYEISSDAEAEEKGISTRIQTILIPLASTISQSFQTWTHHGAFYKVQVDICARPGPPKVESVDLVGGSVRMDSEGEDRAYQRHKSWSKSLQCLLRPQLDWGTRLQDE